MNEVSPLQKQDLSHINHKLDAIVQLLEKIVELHRVSNKEEQNESLQHTKS